MSTAVQVEIVIPESMGKVEALAKVSTSLQGVIARKRREWRQRLRRIRLAFKEGRVITC